MKIVALDAFGSDHAPGVEVEGAIEAARTGRVRVLLVGDRTRLERELADRGGAGGLPIEVRHASQTITMHDAPSHAVRRKTDSSMRVATDLCKAGEAEAVVSAGNSGAMLACGLFVLKRIGGVDRPAILTSFPTRTGQAALLDMGANVECKPLHLVEFAVMGATFARLCHDKARPKVGVLSNGSEEHKGTELTRGAHALLAGASSSRFDYVGYVEGRDIFSGAVDVVVCDGFSGNLVLKVTEGAAEALLGFIKEAIASSFWARLFALGLRPAFRRVKRRMDYAEQGGAPLLGVRGVAIICHGSSNAKAIKNAILGAGRFVDLRLAQSLQGDLEAHAPLRERARGNLSAADQAGSGGDAASSQATSR